MLSVCIVAVRTKWALPGSPRLVIMAHFALELRLPLRIVAKVLRRGAMPVISAVVAPAAIAGCDGGSVIAHAAVDARGGREVELDGIGVRGHSRFHRHRGTTGIVGLARKAHDIIRRDISPRNLWGYPVSAKRVAAGRGDEGMVARTDIHKSGLTLREVVRQTVLAKPAVERRCGNDGSGARTRRRLIGSFRHHRLAMGRRRRIISGSSDGRTVAGRSGKGGRRGGKIQVGRPRSSSTWRGAADNAIRSTAIPIAICRGTDETAVQHDVGLHWGVV
mmetsp:Transcript_17009/g.40764  ORF Transcript_17009/g.40764 Transcript_17009/m.40764 type:complete len:276 (-) Transcript_17009:91-918(-)